MTRYSYRLLKKNALVLEVLGGRWQITTVLVLELKQNDRASTGDLMFGGLRG